MSARGAKFSLKQLQRNIKISDRGFSPKGERKPRDISPNVIPPKDISSTDILSECAPKKYHLSETSILGNGISLSFSSRKS